MQTVEFVGGKGTEQVELVDVRHLQTKCMGLGETGGVRTLLDLQQHREKREKLENIMSCTLSAQITLTTVRSVLSDSWEDRVAEVQVQRSERHVDTMHRKLDQFRQPTPNRFSHHELGRKPMTAGAKLWSGAKLEPDGADRKIERTRDILEDFWGEDEEDEGSQGNASLGGSRTPGKKRRRKCIQDVPPEVVKKATRGWVQARGVVKFLRFVYFRHMRKLQSIEIVRSIAWQLSEWARIRRAMSKLLSNVKVLQRCCRAFLAIRDKRCAG